MCERCESEYADVDGLCSLCVAETSFDVSDSEAVESERARYVGTGARLDTKHTGEKEQ